MASDNVKFGGAAIIGGLVATVIAVAIPSKGGGPVDGGPPLVPPKVRVIPHPCTMVVPSPSKLYFKDGVGEAHVIWLDADAGYASQEMVVNCKAPSEAKVWEKCQPVWRKAFCAGK
jgi:hypothetical protein